MSGVDDLTKALLTWDLYRTPTNDDPERYSSERPPRLSDLVPLLARGPNDTRAPFFKGLQQILGSQRTDRGAGLNFESLIHACDDLAHVLPNERDERFRWMLETLFEVRQRYAAWREPRLSSVIESIAEEARYFILDHVARECSAAARPHPAATGLRALAERFLLRIHSLNYDDLALDVGLDAYTGFHRRTGLFRPRYPWPDGEHGFVQLHGSVRWALIDSEMRAFRSIDSARQEWRSRHNQHGVQDGRALPFVPMITGLRKADLVLDRPYGTYFHVFREHLLSTPRWLIVGYGFGDPHVNRALQQAWQNLKMRREKDRRVVVVDYVPSAARNTRMRNDDDTAGWLKTRSLLEATFPDELASRWRLRYVRPFPERGLVPIDSVGRVTVQLDGSTEALTAGVDEIAGFLSQQ